MDKLRAIPQGYMTVGQLAKKMKTTVRTLQYYDKEGLLSPSKVSEGGRRLYDDKDVVKLHQIQSMKYLGFSLDDIKTRLVALDTPKEVAAVLNKQAAAMREKIADLKKTLKTIESLSEETLKMQTVDWRKYADIVVLMQMGNENYWVVTHFEDKTMEVFRNRFENRDPNEIIIPMERLFSEAKELSESNVLPDSEKGLKFAKEFWDTVMDATGGDMSLIPDLTNFAAKKDSWASKRLREKWAAAEPYIEKAIAAYFTKLGVNPFEGND
ncbi:MAG: MerR family transcriptional regulator [Lachnospiraceae bacterium]|nr:MerR family transcriptional regulator [Lachnospiraceae bacterium]